VISLVDRISSHQMYGVPLVEHELQLDLEIYQAGLCKNGIRPTIRRLKSGNAIGNVTATSVSAVFLTQLFSLVTYL
jgi:hypothetical protein